MTMQKSLIRVATFVAAAYALPAVAGIYAFFDPDQTGNRLWSYSSAWYTCGDYKNDQMSYRGNITQLGVPGDGKAVMVDSNLLTPELPLKIDDGRDVEVSQLNMAYYLGSPYGDEPHMVALEVGEGATLRTTQATANFNVGYCENGEALMLVDADALVSNSNFRVGVSGLGIVTNRGGRVVCGGNASQGFRIGCNSTAVGVYAQVSGSLKLGTGHVGVNGSGRLEILGGGMNGTTMVGEASGGHGTVELSGVVVTNQATVGCAAGAWGCLHLRGATNYAPNVVKIRDNADAYGQLRGWGSVYAYSSDNICGEMNNFFMNGQTIADGEGVDGRMLDLRLIRTGDGGKYSNVKVTIQNGATGTNGWYAVNKGILAYPMIYVRGASWTGTFGANTNEFCDAVNTVRIDYNQTSNKGPWLEAQLYANDSSLVPSGLEGRLLGVWGFRSNVKYDNRDSQLDNLTDFSLRFRYDHQSLKPNSRIALMRYNQSSGEWHRIARAEYDTASPFISAAALTADGADYDRNLGIFAVVDEGRSGMLIIFR